MKTIRRNCFETNSSSTHSITLVKNNSLNKNTPDYLPIYHDGKLLPGNLKPSVYFSEINMGYDTAWSLICKDADSKAAWTMQHLKAVAEYNEFEDKWEMSEDDFKKLTLLIVERLKNDLGYKEIDPVFDHFVYCYSEDGYSPTDIFGDDSMTIEERVDEYMKTVILDSNVSIVETEQPY